MVLFICILFLYDLFTAFGRGTVFDIEKPTLNRGPNTVSCDCKLSALSLIYSVIPIYMYGHP